MPDPLKAVVERVETIRSNLNTFRISGDAALLEDVLEELEEAHDEIEDILDDCE